MFKKCVLVIVFIAAFASTSVFMGCKKKEKPPEQITTEEAAPADTAAVDTTAKETENP